MVQSCKGSRESIHLRVAWKGFHSRVMRCTLLVSEATFGSARVKLLMSAQLEFEQEHSNSSLKQASYKLSQ